MSIKAAISKAGSQAEIAIICGVSQPAVQKWADKGKLPRTEWTKETNYAEKIFNKLGVIIPPFNPQENEKSS